MINVFETNKILVILINTTAIWLGLWVYASNKTKKLNKIFGLTIILMLIWVDFAYLARLIYFGLYIDLSDIYLSLMFLKIAWFAMPLFFSALYLLMVQLIGKEQEYRHINAAIIFVSIAASIITGFTNFVVQDIYFGYDFLTITYGQGKLFFLTLITFIITMTVLMLLKEYYNISSKEKEKIEYFLAGMIVFYSSNAIFNIIFPIFGINRYYFVGYYSAIILIAFIALAIVRKKLFNIKIILTALLVGFIAILLALDIVAFTQSPTLQILKVMSLLIFIYLGKQLITSVLKEEERAEKKEKLARDLEKANAYLQELMDMKASFLHIVSHQLRTPLTAMRGFISIWNEGGFDSYSPQKMAEIKERIANNAERLNNLVNDMVVAMESEGDLKLKFDKVNVEELVKNNMEFLKSNYEKKGLYIRYENQGKKLCEIEADPKYLSNAFMNLIDNAEKYTEKGGLRIKASCGGANVKLEFIDTGVGIKKEDKKMLFQKFSRGSESSRINPNGSGLGLFIIKEIIKKHQGTVEFESPGEQKGTTFTIILPKKQPIQEEPEKKPSQITSQNSTLSPDSNSQSAENSQNSPNIPNNPLHKKQQSFLRNKQQTRKN